MLFSRLRVNLRAVFHELFRLRFQPLLPRLVLGEALSGVAFEDVFGDSHRARMHCSRSVCHDESGSALFIECGVEELNPEVIGVVGARQAEGEAAARSDHVLQPLLVHSVDVERRVGEDRRRKKDE